MVSDTFGAVRRALKSPFDEVDGLLAAFRGVEGFAPYTFVAWAEPPGSDRRAGELVRAFRYEAWACISHVVVHGPPRAAWHRGVAKGLMQAGYERRLRFNDQTDFRRSLTTARSRVAELAFLRALGENGNPERWPTRKPVPYRERRTAPRHWASVMATVRSSGIHWTDACIGFKRCAPVVIGRGPTGFELCVSVLTMHAEPLLRVSVGLFHPTNRRAQVPAPLLRLLRRELREAGYEFMAVKSTGRATGHLHAHRDTSSAGAAVTECLRIFDRLTRLRW
jgi:hypothetical protein